MHQNYSLRYRRSGLRVCLLYPPRPGGAGTNLVPPIGLLYLGAILERDGHEVTLVDCALSGAMGADLVRNVVDTDPEILMISAFTSDVAILQPSLNDLRSQLPDTRFWLGGPHASCVGIHALDDFPTIDAVFLGEAEESVPEAISSPDGATEGVIFRRSRNLSEPRHIEDLSSLPLPAWHLAPPSLYRGLPNGVVFKRLPYAPILTTRGCPYKCSFCAGFRITGRKIRHRPLDSVWSEIELLVRDYGVREIHIEDDNFTLDSDYAKEFCRQAISRAYPILFSTPNGVRLDSLDDELLGLMKSAGWYIVHCGIESGSDNVLRRTRKATTTERIRETIQRIHDHDLHAAGYFIIGLPGETKEDIEQTIRFARTLRLEWAHFASFLPIPGSEDGDRYLEGHDLSADGWAAFHNTSCVAPPESITRRELKRLQRKAFSSFYLRPAPAFRTVRLFLRSGSAFRLIRRASAYMFGIRDH
jgi:radical SAM superfamily enzyme YgiQ (UPF0313 family)